MRIILNADDLGMSDFVNNQIEQCIKLGVVTSCSLMANSPAFEKGVMLAQKYPYVSVGVHLNIIEFKPLTNRDVFTKHGLVDKDGMFIDGAAFDVQYDDELKKAVREEWDAQITKIESTGLVPTHCDSHQHTHTIEALQDILRQVMKQHGITKVRRKIIPSIRLMLLERHKQSLVHLEKTHAKQAPKRNIIYRRIHLFIVKIKTWQWNKTMGKEFLMTEAFYSFRDFYNFRSALHLEGELSTIELMCHPGNRPFDKETEILMSSRRWIRKNDELISYYQL